MELNILIAIVSLIIGYNLDVIFKEIYQLIFIQNIKGKCPQKIYLNVPHSTNSTIEFFFDKILEKFICSWYSFGERFDFLSEIRYYLYRFFNSLLVRFTSIDIGQFVSRKIIPLIIQHYQHIQPLIAEAKFQNNVINDNPFNKLGPHTHYAMLSRTIEYRYLLSISDKIIMREFNFSPCNCLITYKKTSKKQTNNFLDIGTIDTAPAYFYRSNSLNLHSKISYIHCSLSQGNNFKNHHILDALYALLREFTASTILLHLMDFVSQPDFINGLLINILKGPKKDFSIRKSHYSDVRLLQNFHLSWKESVIKKPVINSVEKYFFENSVVNHEFQQFMKRINFLNLYSFLILMRKMRKLFQPGFMFSSEVKLLLTSLNELQNMISVTNDQNGNVDRVFITCDEPFEIPLEFYQLMMDHERFFDQTRFNFIRFANYCVTIFKQVKQYINEVLMPLYYESPEYLSFFFGINQNLPKILAKSPSKSKSQETSLCTEEYQTCKRQVSDSSATSKVSRSISTDVSDIDLSEYSISILRIAQSFVEMPRNPPSTSSLAALAVGVRCENENQTTVIASKHFTFVIQTSKWDKETKTYHKIATVNRKYSDFYVLEQKLQEFHGSSIKESLPAKKTFQLKSVEFLDSQIGELERYLRYLISEPFLKGSELINGFLISEDVPFANISLELGKFVKSVPMRLSKERGQNLDVFMRYFRKSCEEISDPTPNKVIFSIASEESDLNQDDPLGGKSGDAGSKKSIYSDALQNRLHSSLFWNNAGLTTDQVQFKSLNDKCQKTYSSITSISSAMSLFLEYLKRISHNLLDDSNPIVKFNQIVLNMISYFVHILSECIDELFEKKISMSISEFYRNDGMVDVFKSFTDTLFPKTKIIDCNREPENRYEEAKNLLTQNISNLKEYDILEMLPENFENDALAFFEIFQNPKLNKQLAYEIFDKIFKEIYPEFNDENVNLKVDHEATITSNKVDNCSISDQPENLTMGTSEDLGKNQQTNSESPSMNKLIVDCKNANLDLLLTPLTNVNSANSQREKSYKDQDKLPDISIF